VPGRPDLERLNEITSRTGIIAADKIADYVLSPSHPDGRGKAAYLAVLGYTRDDWRQLESDLRSQHVVLDAAPGRASPYGVKYEIVGNLTGPNGRTGRIRTVWIVRHDEDVPRLVTLIPEG
jgi:uncharacterized protein DUF6883